MNDNAPREFEPDFTVISLDKESLAREFKRRVFFKEDEREEDCDNDGARELGERPD